MPFVQARCVNCNGQLEVDSSKRAAICPYCGTPYVVEDAINHYHNHIEHLHADVVNQYVDESGSEARLKAGETFLLQKHYDLAKQAFRDAANSAPQNYLGWWGQIRAITCEFTRELGLSQLDELQQLFDSAIIVAPADRKAELQAKFDAYYGPRRKKGDAEHTALIKRRKQLIAREEELRVAQGEYANFYMKDIRGLPNWVGSILALMLLVGIIRFFVKGGLFFSRLVVLPIVIYLADVMICFVRKQAQKARRKKYNHMHKKIQAERDQIYREQEKISERIRQLER